MKIDVPVLIMSGFSEVDVRSRFAEDPKLSFIPKPFNSEQLSQRLEELLRRSG
jgi:DNA-binding response OmpR family regulator